MLDVECLESRDTPSITLVNGVLTAKVNAPPAGQVARGATVDVSEVNGLVVVLLATDAGVEVGVFQSSQVDRAVFLGGAGNDRFFNHADLDAVFVGGGGRDLAVGHARDLFLGVELPVALPQPLPAALPVFPAAK